MSANSGAGEERRTAARYLVHLPVTCHCDGGTVAGFVVDVSASGARIEATFPDFRAGTAVELGLCWFPMVEPPQVQAELVREAEGGVAVRFRDADAFLRAMLDLARRARPAGDALDPQRALRRAQLLDQLNRM